VVLKILQTQKESGRGTQEVKKMVFLDHLVLGDLIKFDNFLVVTNKLVKLDFLESNSV